MPAHCLDDSNRHGELVERREDACHCRVFEIVTFPLPPYEPVWTSYVNPSDWYLYPDRYKPGLIADSMFSTDSNLGFSGGDVAPWSPGSSFKVFDLH